MGDDVHGGNEHSVECLQGAVSDNCSPLIRVLTHKYPNHDIVLGLEVLDTAQLEISRYTLIPISAGLL